VIIVVEGPTAAGKTTWATVHAGAALVTEAMPAAERPMDPSDRALFWAQIGAARWQQAVAAEQRAGIAVCDTDPLKLHYSWSLWRIGAGSESAFLEQAGAYREMVAQSRIGFAEAYFVSIPDSQTLEGRRSQDTTRRRRNFSLHARLGEPLREWYAALDELRPGSVRWSFPDEGIGEYADAAGARYDLETFDALVRRVAG